MLALSKTSKNHLLLLLSIYTYHALALFGSKSPVQKEAYDYVNLLIGNGGDTPNGSGGMIPSTAPPFAMTRWVAQTHQNYVSVTPYNWTADTIHGFQATRQPAIWMGESGGLVVVPGVSSRSGKGGKGKGKKGKRDLEVKAEFEERGLKMRKETEVIAPAFYSIVLEDGLGGEILVEQSATSRVGHLRFTFSTDSPEHTPYILLESSRPSIITSDPTNLTYPHGTIALHLRGSQRVHEICGSNTERQDSIITPTSTRPHVAGFSGYYCARFEYEYSSPSSSSYDTPMYGTIHNGTISPGSTSGQGPLLSGYAAFPSHQSHTKNNVLVTVTLRIGTSLISTNRARSHIDTEIPDGRTLEETVGVVRGTWVEKLGRFSIEGAKEEEKEVFWTAVAHTLQYPSEQSEHGSYYSGYDGKVHLDPSSSSYTGYSIWDTYRAEWAFLILIAPERVPGMVASMLSDYKQSGWLPMWKNIVETNIMVGTHADSLIAEAIIKLGTEHFDTDLAWDAVLKDASVPPVDDLTTSYSDREEGVDYEVRAGLSSSYAARNKGWVADDVHSESASRTLAYAYDDYAAYRLGTLLKKRPSNTEPLLARAQRAPFALYNPQTGFMEARNGDGTWAGEGRGWTEGDKWAYSFDVVHDIPGLVEKRGGNESFVRSLDEHFDGGHNDHSNEPSHHIPYLYALAGAAYKTQERVREIARENYDNTPTGLSGNEDCGQMSAWYIFSAMGFYPVNPVSGEYVVGSPFFDKLTIDLPPPPPPPSTSVPSSHHQYQHHQFQHHHDQEPKNPESDVKSRKLTISAPGAQTKPYVKSLTINGRSVDRPIIRHEDIKDGGEIVFEMSEVVEEWGNTNANANAERPAMPESGREEEQVVIHGAWEHVEL